MARAIVGGLIFSTLITLVVLPAIYAIFDDWRSKSGKFFARAVGREPRVKSTTLTVAK